jgi:2,3-bisphosphoglycerate-dependent phosphoglycerate mutase
VDLVFVRHARPVRHDVVKGRADPGLSEEGHLQAGRLARWLAGERIEVVYASPARRAVETAEPLARQAGRDCVIDEGLAEFDREATSYVPVEELAANDERWLALARGELYADADPVAFRKRVVEAVEAIIAAHPTPLWFSPGYTSISRVAASRRGARSVVSLNEMGHQRAGPR